MHCFHHLSQIDSWHSKMDLGFHHFNFLDVCFIFNVEFGMNTAMEMCFIMLFILTDFQVLCIKVHNSAKVLYFVFLLFTYYCRPFCIHSYHFWWTMYLKLQLMTMSRIRSNFVKPLWNDSKFSSSKISPWLHLGCKHALKPI